MGAASSGSVTAADEIVRWATPVTAFQRTAVKDTELGGVPIKAGQRVVMFYRSANDEEVFGTPTPSTSCDPNPHVGFGGTGVHYCLGANLARMTIDLMFNAIADNMPDSHPSEPRAVAVGLAQRHQALAGRLQRQPPRRKHTIRRIRWTSLWTPEQQAVADVANAVLDRENSWAALVSGV